MKERHVPLGEMRRLLAGKAAAQTPQRLLQHLAVGCTTCWERAEKLVSEPPRPAPPASEPVARALWRFLAVERFKATPVVPEPEWFTALGAQHRRVTSETRQLPLGFAHLVLEEGREATLEERQGVRILAEARTLVTRPAMAQGRMKEFRDLQARASAYLADAYCRIQPASETLDGVFEGRVKAFLILVESFHLWREGTGDIELEATLREILARSVLCMGLTEGAVELLTSAEALLDDPEHQGRRAEVMLQRAAALLVGDRLMAGRAAIFAALELEQTMVKARRAESEPQESQPALQDVARIIREAELALAGSGEGLRFQVTPDSGLRIVRRLGPLPNEPPDYEAVVALETEPALWLIDRPEGRYCLVVPLGGADALASGFRGPVEVYFDGMPIPWSSAVARPSLLAALHEIAAFLWQALPTEMPDQDQSCNGG